MVIGWLSRVPSLRRHPSLEGISKSLWATTYLPASSVYFQVARTSCYAQQTSVHRVTGSYCLVTIYLGVTSDPSTQCLPRQ